MELTSPDFYKGMLDHLSDGVYFVDRNRLIHYWNQAAVRLTGYEAREVVGLHCNEDLLGHMDDAGNELCLNGCPLTACIKDGQTRSALVQLRHKDGHRVPVSIRVQPMLDDQNRVVGALEIFSDDKARAEDLRKAEEIRRIAFQDCVTQLPNRRSIEMTLESAVEEFARNGKPFGVLMLDLNHFKRINDTYGHACGDRALKQTAIALSGSVRPVDVVGRWGGDEFVAVVRDVSRDSLGVLARRCASAVDKATMLSSKRGIIPLAISVGATLVQQGETPSEILARADSMMYESKSSGHVVVG